MPATAAHEGPDEEPSLASVVELASRRSEKALTIEDAIQNASDEDVAEQARQHWVKVFRTARIDLSSRETSAVVTLVTKELERLVTGLLVIREGREGLPANPQAGVDFTSAVELTGVLRDLARAATRD
ncbi:hypothetical protein [Streptomyces sp. SP17KL33]|uniref:hypothetical protein n=1 Tax=Streptomyces sp. SP17KL33 TaxID=3002534 RepID=UPI002E789C20|nr:hypothetical protein [Streptomyces sp. SP17KL33]MEE1838138.1 hypothetical protein [Streptomyces sp. SP17KL33]